MMPPSTYKKINQKFIDFINRKAYETKAISSINPYEPLENQELSEETKSVLAIIYDSYLKKDDDELEKDSKIDKELVKNEKTEENNNKNTWMVVVQKKNIFKRIFEKIRNRIIRKKFS